MVNTDSIPSTYKVLIVDSDTEQTIDLNEWELIDRKYDLGKFVLLFQHIPKEVVERVLNSAKNTFEGNPHEEHFHNGPGGIIDDEDYVEAKNAWEEDDE